MVVLIVVAIAVLVVVALVRLAEMLLVALVLVAPELHPQLQVPQ